MQSRRRFFGKPAGSAYSDARSPMDDLDEFSAVPLAPPPSETPAPKASPLARTVAVAVAPRVPSGDRARAGLGLVAAAAGTAAGAIFGGRSGAAIGLVGVGAIRNLFRAQHLGSNDAALRGDATRSAALCVVGFGVVGYLVYRILKEDD